MFSGLGKKCLHGDLSFISYGALVCFSSWRKQFSKQVIFIVINNLFTNILRVLAEIKPETGNQQTVNKKNCSNRNKFDLLYFPLNC